LSLETDHHVHDPAAFIDADRQVVVVVDLFVVQHHRRRDGALPWEPVGDTGDGAVSLAVDGARRLFLVEVVEAEQPFKAIPFAVFGVTNIE
jgi:hypothetical protein